MKIDTRKWHYRVWCWSFSEKHPAPDSTNLCDYFWRIVGTVSFGAMLVFCLLFWSGMAIYYGFIESQVGWYVVAIAAALLAFGWFIDRLEKWQAVRDAKPPRPPGLLRSYLRAKKAKVCPMVEFEG